MGGVDIIRDGDEAHPVGREHPAQVAAGFDVLTPQAGQVLDDDTVDYTVRHILHHFLERRAVKDDAAVTIVDLLRDDFNIRVALHEVLNELALVGNAVAFAGTVIGIGKSDICRCLVLWHKKALLSSRCLP